MAEKIKLVHGDTKPALVVSLTDQSTGDPIDVATATVRMKFRAAGGDTVLSTLTASKIAGRVLTDGTVNSAAPYDVPGKGGRVQFGWGIGDLNQDAGDYEGEIEITYSDSSVQTVYDVLKFKLRKDF
ncbi:hypothetical protein UFOVP236_43 [uncultured Caudovirales phage]|uniref:BppU N-terminal domain-containing protein n=1 Tax=uncultured Caudovirales phage TaxID=2100421 RepID=A0A6J7WW68_9CAUD|nr:hypothetical protein UFOVP236_43 [uncultured Caudovirales phage]